MSPGRLGALLGLLGLVVMVLLVVLSPKPLFYDEPYYLNHVGYVEKYGLGTEFLKEYPGYAGPLFAVVHWLLKPITALAVPGVRLVNIGLLLGCIGVLGRLKPGGRPAAWWLVSVPLVWPLAGLALTEMASMFFLSVYLLLWQMSGDDHRGRSRWLLALLAGLAFGIAIVGRQTMLVCLVAPVVSLLFESKSRGRGLVSLGAAVVLPILVFGIWGGLKPPMIQAVTEMGRFVHRPFAVDHLALSFGYAFVLVALIAPRFLKMNWRLVAGAAVAGALLATVFLPQGFVPSRSLAEVIVPEALISLLGHGCAMLLFFGGSWLFARLCWEGWNSLFGSKLTAERAGHAAAVGALLFTPLVITHTFSSRYVVVVLPFLLPLLAPYVTTGWGDLLRRSLGVSLGIAMLFMWLYRGGIDQAHTRELQLFYPHLWDSPENKQWGDTRWKDELGWESEGRHPAPDQGE